jgi:hypothetical protein
MSLRQGVPMGAGVRWGQVLALPSHLPPRVQGSLPAWLHHVVGDLGTTRSMHTLALSEPAHTQTASEQCAVTPEPPLVQRVRVGPEH